MIKFDFSLLSKIKDELRKNDCFYVMCPYIFDNLVRNLDRESRSKFLFKYYEDHNLIFKMLDVDWADDDSIYKRCFGFVGMDKTNAVLAKLLGNDVVEMDDLLNGAEIKFFSPPYYTKWYLVI